MNSNKINYLLSKKIITIYSDLGVVSAFVSPGSRNTPLMLALSDQNKIKVYNIIDERSSGYLALGLSKISKVPSLLITTSGTAVSNLFPSIVEAYMSNHPMIILTADRPKNLIGTGANQTINQTNIFKEYVNEFIDMSDVEKENIFNTLNKSYYQAMGYYDLNKGPIHINIPFEAPLHLENRSNIKILKNNIFNLEENKYNSNNVDINIKKYSKPIIICTDYTDLNIILFSEKYNIPIFMECLGSRFIKESKTIISSYNFILNYSTINPDIIFRFGNKPISNILNNFIKMNKNIEYLITDKIFNDDAKNTIDFDYLTNLYMQNKIRYNNSWLEALINKQNKIKIYFDKLFAKPIHHEGYIINKIVSMLPVDSNLIIGNSSPIRDLDKFSFNKALGVSVFANRGASGIDGLISTSLGISLHKQNKTYLILGDISFFYDMSSLSIAIPSNLTIIILNNNGGHIFDRLDGLSNEKDYSKYWLTPQDLNIKSIANAFKCNYTQINYKELGNKKSKAFLGAGVNLIEINIDSKKHHLNNKEIEENIKNILT